MKLRGLFLVTTDRSKSGTSKFTIGRIRVADKEFPGYISCIENITGENYLRSEHECIIPGAYYSGDRINLELIGRVQIWSEGIGITYSSEEARNKIQEGDFLVSLGNYVFNEKLLSDSVQRFSAGLFEALPVEIQIDSTERKTVSLAFSKVIAEGAKA
jgi:hypothetical protein